MTVTHNHFCIFTQYKNILHQYQGCVTTVKKYSEHRRELFKLQKITMLHLKMMQLTKIDYTYIVPAEKKVLSSSRNAEQLNSHPLKARPFK